MILRDFPAKWQNTAGFGGSVGSRYAARPWLCTDVGEALLPRTQYASNCQNRYPSPSRRSGQYPLIGPTCSTAIRQSFACFCSRTAVVIAYQRRNGLLEARSSKLHNFRGNTRCKRNSQLRLLSRSLVCRPVVKAQTWSARPSAGSPAAWSVTSSAKEAALRAVSLAQDLALWPTTSTCKTHPGTSRSRNTTKGCPSASWTALFVALALGPHKELTCSRKS